MIDYEKHIKDICVIYVAIINWKLVLRALATVLLNNCIPQKNIENYNKSSLTVNL